MPRYDYQCERGHRYEKQESFGAPAQQPCERCGAPANRVFGAPSIVFKGSGWYSTDSQRTLRSGVGTARDGEVGGSETHSAAEAASEGPSAAVGARAPRKAADTRPGRVATKGSKPVAKAATSKVAASKVAKAAKPTAKAAAKPATKAAAKTVKAAAKSTTKAAAKAAKPAAKATKAVRPAAKSVKPVAKSARPAAKATKAAKPAAKRAAR